MEKDRKETIRIRFISTSFVILALVVFKPFGLDAGEWKTYVHLLALFALGFTLCMLTDLILKYVARIPDEVKHDVGDIIHRNLLFQLINTPLIALGICLYRHFFMSEGDDLNRLSWNNFLETLLIIAFCSFAIGLYWRFKLRSRFLAEELEETRLLNEQLKRLQQEAEQRAKAAEIPTMAEPAVLGAESPASEQKTQASLVQQPATGNLQTSSTIVLAGTTSESITLQIPNLLYIEAVGNYVKVCHLFDGQVQTDMLRATSKQMEDDLRAFPMIVRCHRAFLVNLGLVERIVSKAGSMQLVMKHSHDTIPVSRSNMAGVKETIQAA